jgi:hypothetical protein
MTIIIMQVEVPFKSTLIQSTLMVKVRGIGKCMGILSRTTYHIN